MGVGTGNIGIKATEALMVHAVLPARLDATFCWLLARLPVVHFDRSARGIAGRHEIGFYRKMEIVINPTTYA